MRTRISMLVLGSFFGAMVATLAWGSRDPTGLTDAVFGFGVSCGFIIGGWVGMVLWPITLMCRRRE